MITGTTSSGFAYTLDEAVLNDWEIMDLLSEVDTNPLNIPKLGKKILGREQYQDLWNSLKNEEGRAAIADMTKAITEIFEGGKPAKNS